MSYYYDNTAEERRIDSDLSCNCEYNLSGDTFQLDEVAYVLASVMGENDGPQYFWLCAMKDHTYAVVDGGCDYTGWDCQSSGQAEIYPTLKLAIAALPELDEEYHGGRKIRESVLRQLTGECAFGEVI
jgi:hypothetical protein